MTRAPHDDPVLPPGWARTALGEIGQWASGGTPSRGKKEFFGGSIPWVKTGDLKDRVITDVPESLTDDGLASSSAALFPERTLLMAMYGATIGRLGVLAQPSATNQACAALLPNGVTGDLLPFVFYYLMSIRHALKNAGKGGAQPNISQTVIKRFPIVVAPLGEQRRIVEAVDSYLSRLDDAVATLERVQRNLKRYRASVLKAAVEGRLVPTEAELALKERREYEAADVLLARILNERKTRWIEQQAEKSGAKAEAKATKAGKPWTKADDQAALAKARTAAAKKYKEPAPPDTSDLPGLPEGWCWATWAQLGFSQNGRAFPSKDYQDDGVKLLRPGNLNESGRVEWTKPNTRRMPERWAEQHPAHIVGPGELVMNLTAQSLKDEFLGRVCLTGVGERCLLNQRIARLSPILVNERYLLWMLKAPIFRRFVDSLNTGSLIQHMFTSQLANFVLPLPPGSEQHRIADEVERLLTVGDATERVANNSKLRVAALGQSILKWAFEGKLVDQAPNDEPASVLLDRIKTERENAQAAAKAKKKPARTKRKKKSA